MQPSLEESVLREWPWNKHNTDDGIDVVRNRILGTIGNIYLQLGNVQRKSENLAAAKSEYEHAKYHFERADRKDKWALFGLAEALFWTGDPRGQQILKDEVRKKAIDEEVNRVEPRTKVLAKTTELICCIRVPEFKREVPTIYSQLTEALGRVEARLTVYSQAQRRNVGKEVFRKDLQGLMEEHASFPSQEPPVMPNSESDQPPPRGEGPPPGYA